MFKPGMRDGTIVHCRIGSLEVDLCECERFDNVHCRIGSLEVSESQKAQIVSGSLPYRQLRRRMLMLMTQIGCSLPYRQLRRIEEKPKGQSDCSLPYRQLRR